jgi:hypothetical protein
MQFFFKSTELHQRAALTGARNRSVSLWHGMPTASVKDKLFLQSPIIANLFRWNLSSE